MTQGIPAPDFSTVEFVEEVHDYGHRLCVTAIYQTRGPLLRGLAIEHHLRAYLPSEMRMLREFLYRSALNAVRELVMAHRAVTEPIPND